MGNDNVRYFVKGKMMEEVDSRQDCRIMFSRCHTRDSQEVSYFLSVHRCCVRGCGLCCARPSICTLKLI